MVDERLGLNASVESRLDRWTLADFLGLLGFAQRMTNHLAIDRGMIYPGASLIAGIRLSGNDM
jgi:hypothetical protein